MESRKVSVVLFLAYLFSLLHPDRLNLAESGQQLMEAGLLSLEAGGIVLMQLLCFLPLGAYLELLFREANWGSNLSKALLVCLILGKHASPLTPSWGVGVVLLSQMTGVACGIVLLYILTSLLRENTYKWLHLLALVLSLLVIFYGW